MKRTKVALTDDAFCGDMTFELPLFQFKEKGVAWKWTCTTWATVVCDRGLQVHA